MEKDQKLIAESFGLAVKVERVRRRLSQEELAHQADLNVSYLSRTERGLSQPTLWTIAKLASAMGVTPQHLVELAMQNLESNMGRPISFEASEVAQGNDGDKISHQ